MTNLKDKVIKMLTEDARFTSKNISDILSVQESEVKAIIKDLEDSGAILKYSTIIDRQKLDSNFIDAFVEIKVVPMKSGGYDDIADTLVGFDEIKSLALLSGGYDFVMTVEGKSIRDVAFFVSERLSTLDCVKSTATHFVLKKYKSESVILERKEQIERFENN